MYRRLLAIAFAAALAIGCAVALDPGSATAAPTVQLRGGDRDCSDFATQRAAQIFFLNHGGPQRDPHRLDSEGDGIACESNPCPCYYGSQPPGDGGGGGGGDSPPPPKTLRQKGNVIRVIDGDTVKVKLWGGGRRVVRILGIDTPEMAGQECGSLFATRSAREFMPRGSFVLLISDTTQPKEDRYNRLLRYVHKRSGYDVGRGQLRRGWAKVFVVNKPFKRVESYRRTQAEANRADRGVWGLC